LSYVYSLAAVANVLTGCVCCEQ